VTGKINLLHNCISELQKTNTGERNIKGRGRSEKLLQFRSKPANKKIIMDLSFSKDSMGLLAPLTAMAGSSQV
jgi:hypothetical protein